MKVLLVFGTRPEAIKLIPVVKELKEDSRFQVTVCVTGQHKEILHQMLSFFNVQPDFNLDLMLVSQSLSQLGTSVISAISALLEEVRPDWILLQGDTTTALGAALGGYYNRVPIAHIEAGLRTGHLYSPWPEEGNRKLIDSITALHCVPTIEARDNLLRENVPHGQIAVTGNTVIDALHLAKSRIESNPVLQKELEEHLPYFSQGQKTVLVTNHRRESFGKGLEGICLALRQLALTEDVILVYPVHPNPNVRTPVYAMLKDLPNLHLLPPLDYPSFVYAMMHSYFIISDSGGVQEEAPALGKPILVTRSFTERPEGVEKGCAQLVGTDPAHILSQAQRLLHDEVKYKRMATVGSIYGDGLASSRIRTALLKYADAQGNRMKSVD